MYSRNLDSFEEPAQVSFPHSSATGSVQQPWISTTIFLVMVAVLVSSVQFPPLLDFANHYARLWLIAGGVHEPPLQQIYSIDWSRASTNISIDLAAQFIGPLIGIPLLMRLLLFLAIALPPIGAMLLHQRIFGGRFYWQIAFLYFAWCSTLIGGFINFQIGLGLALLSAALEYRLREGSFYLLLGWRIIASLLLTVTHVFSLGFYIILVCALEFGPSLRIVQSWPTLRATAIRIALAVMTCLIIPMTMFMLAPSLPGSHVAVNVFHWHDNLNSVMNYLLSAIRTYELKIDLLMLAPLALVIAAATILRQLSNHAGLVIAFVGLLILSLISPGHAFGTAFIGWRFPIMAALVGMVMFCPFAHLKGRRGLVLASLLTIAVLGRVVWIGANWWEAQRDVEDVQVALRQVPRGAAILPVKHDANDNTISESPSYRYFGGGDTFRHLATLAVPEAHAFIPTLFTAQGKQPLMVQPGWSELAVPEGDLASIQTLICPAFVNMRKAHYVKRWRDRFDFILVLNADKPDQFVGAKMPDGLSLMVNTTFADLYKVNKSASVEIPSEDCSPLAKEQIRNRDLD